MPKSNGKTDAFEASLFSSSAKFSSSSSVESIRSSPSSLAFLFIVDLKPSLSFKKSFIPHNMYHAGGCSAGLSHIVAHTNLG